jgi:lipoate-protein ligase A
MAADEALLADVAAGAPPALRLYTWATPALSLGRFQAWDDVDAEACARLGVEAVRRPTGGKALLHGADLTYAVALRRPPGRAGSVRAVYDLLAAALVDGLARVGVGAAVARHDGSRPEWRAGSVPERPAGPVCFATQQGADLRVGDRKLCGSAQTRTTQAVLQHGSILLDRLPFDETDVLRPPPRAPYPGRGALRAITVTLAELGATPDASAVAQALVEGFGATLDVEFTPSPAAAV